MKNKNLLGFRENNFLMVLKYDGERIKNKYTVVLIPLLERNDIKHCDTESYFEILNEFIDEKGIDVDIETREYFTKTFEKLTSMLIDKYNENIVFNFGIRNSNGFAYDIYLNIEGNSNRMTTESFDEVLQFLRLKEIWK
ncbi:MAG: hypothetical protein JEZ00_17225 [Anaerolineaceae bacterium]|nr:hypothetical protein [Anaerolineaceae bacterium]